MRKVRIAPLLSLIGFLAAASMPIGAKATPQYVFQYLSNDPQRIFAPNDINDSGLIVGQSCLQHLAGDCGGYRYANGVRSPLNHPDQIVDVGSPNRITNGGSISGTYVAFDGTHHSYVLSGTTFTDEPRFNRPDGSVFAINDRGGIAGVYCPLTCTTSFAHGVVQYSTSSPVIDFGTRSYVTGLNDNNDALLFRFPASRTFTTEIYSRAGITTSIAVPGAYSTQGTDINNRGQVSGTYSLSNGGPYQSFVYTDGVFQTLAAPAGGQTFVTGMNDLGQLVGYEKLDDRDTVGSYNTFIATLANVPVAAKDNVFTFDIAVVANVTVFIDPVVAVGYAFDTGAGDPNFKTVRLPVGVGDDQYTIELSDGSIFIVAGGALFDFVGHGFAGGVSHFLVTGIEAVAGLDPSNPQAFVTGLSFVADGNFTGSMSALVANATVPEPATWMLLLLGSFGLWVRRGRVVERCLGSIKSMSRTRPTMTLSSLSNVALAT